MESHSDLHVAAEEATRHVGSFVEAARRKVDTAPYSHPCSAYRLEADLHCNCNRSTVAVAGVACAGRDSRYMEQSAKEEPSAAVQEAVEVGRRSRTTAGLGCTPYREVASGVVAN